MFFKMKKRTGNHSQDGVIYVSGDVVESEKNLCEMFPGKFERIDVPFEIFKRPEKSDVQKAAEEGAKDIKPKKKSKPKPVSDEEVLAIADEPDEEEDEEDKEPLGKDVTKNYKRAGEEDLKVFYKKFKGRWVTEAEDPFTALNKKPLKKDQVVPFIEKWLKG